MCTFRRGSCWHRGRQVILGVALVTLVAGRSAGQSITVVPPAQKDKDKAAQPASSEVRVSEYGTVDIVVQNDDVVNILQKLAIQSRRNIVPSPTVSRTVNATIHGVPLQEALQGLLHPNGLGFVERGEFIYVYTAQELSALHLHLRRQVSRLIHLNYLSAEDGREYARPLLSPDGHIDATKDKAGTQGQGAVSQVVQEIGSVVSGFGAGQGGGASGNGAGGPGSMPTGEFAFNNAIIVHDYPENVDEIEAFLKELDTQPAQVLLEATILQTTLTEDNAFGVDFALLHGVGFTDFFNFPSVDIPLSVKTVQDDAGNRSGPPGADFVISDSGQTGTGDATVRAGIMAGDVGIFIRALDRVTDVILLSNPKVLTLNRQPARVHVGERVGYLETVVVENQILQTIKFIDTGIQLDIRPFVLHDGRIRLELTPKLSDVTFRQVQGTGGVQQQIPDEQIQTVTTDVLVPAGYTAVIGGLFREDTTRRRSQVPLLGDIPILGNAFRGRDDNVVQTEIIFLIKPTVLKDTMVMEQGRRAEAYGEHIRTGARLGLLPWSRERQSSRLNLAAARLAREGRVELALWNIRRSLELHPNQPEIIAMRGRLVTEADPARSRSLLKRILEEAVEPLFDAGPVPPESLEPYNEFFTFLNPAWPRELPADAPPPEASEFSETPPEASS